MDKIKIAIYSRKSRLREGSESIENQIQICKDHIQKIYNNKNYNICVFEDEGFTGGNIKRPQFQKLIKNIKKNKFDVLICYRLDRISRNIADFSDIIELLQAYNVDFISIREQFDTSTPMGRAMMYIASVFAQLERETIAERVKDNMLELAKTGRWLGGQTPYGYNTTGSKENIRLVQNEKELKIVKQLFEQYIKLGSLSKLQGWTIKEKIKSRKNKIFDMSSLKKILTNPVYVIADEDFYKFASNNKMNICNTLEEFKINKSKGLLCFNRTDQKFSKNKLKELKEWIVCIGTHKGIINTQIWLLTQDMIKDNAKLSPRTNTSRIALLSTVLRCKDCGSTFRIVGKYVDGKLTHHYYKCKTKEKSRTTLCNVKNVNGLEAEKMVLEYIKSFNIDEYTAKNEYAKHKDELEENTIDKIINIENDIHKKKDDIEKLTEKLIDTENSTASKYIIDKIEKIDLEIQNLEKELEQLQENKEEENENKINYELLRKEMQYAKENIEHLEFEQQKRLIKNLIEYVLWDGETLSIKPRLI